MSKRRIPKKINQKPPQIPKCVKRCSEGYCTDFVQADPLGKTISFLFKKNGSYYDICYKTIDTSYKSMIQDTKLSPATRSKLSNHRTLTEAVNAVNSWLGKNLPEI